MSDQWKLIETFDEEGLFELYDLKSDPKERADQSWKHPGVRARLSRELAMYGDVYGWP